MNNDLLQIIDIINNKIIIFQKQNNSLAKYQIQSLNNVKNMITDYQKQKLSGIDTSHEYSNILSTLNNLGLGYLIKTKEQEIIIEDEDEDDEYTLKPKNNKITVTKSTIEKKSDYIIKWIKALQCEINESDEIIKVYNDIKTYLMKEYQNMFEYDIEKKIIISKKLTLNQLRITMQHKTHKSLGWSKYLFNIPYFYCKLTGKIPPKLDPYYLKLLKDIAIDYTKFCMNLLILKTTKRMYMGFIIKKSLEFIQKEYGKDFSNIYELIHEQTKTTVANNEKIWLQYTQNPRFNQFKKEIYEKKLINNEEIIIEEQENENEKEDENENEYENELEDEFELENDIFNNYKI